jgi:catechol 2,3-dioxygenase-like lactoylglutathione lyase family enzyme
MLDHVTANVSDLDQSKRFYTQALAPLGYSLQMDAEGAPALAPARGYLISGSARAPRGAQPTSRSAPQIVRR